MGENRLVQISDAKPIVYGDSTDEIKIAYLPKHAVILDVLVYVETGFNGSGTDLVKVGVTGTLEKYLANTTCASSTTMITASQAGSPLVPAAPLTEDSWIVAVYTDQNSNATAGKLLVAIVWAMYWEEPVL